MLHLLLIAQLNAGPPDRLPPPIPATVELLQPDVTANQAQTLKAYQQRVNQRQRQYQSGQEALDVLPPSHVDCQSHFPPIGGNLPTISTIAACQ